MTNADSFDEIAAKVLARLSENFPQGTRLHAEEFVPASDKHAIMNFYYTVKFLGAEGLLGYEVASDDGEVFFEVILTGKGLAALNAVSDGRPGERNTFGQRISEALRHGSPEELKSAINEFITVVATGRIGLPR